MVSWSHMAMPSVPREWCRDLFAAQDIQSFLSEVSADRQVNSTNPSMLQVVEHGA